MSRTVRAEDLCGLYEFAVCQLDFGPYPSVCICTVAAAAPLFLVLWSHDITIHEVDSTAFFVKDTDLVSTR